MATQALFHLWSYWERLTMVELARGYFGTPFKGYRGVTQWDHLSPTIFNMVVYTFLQQCFIGVASTEETVDPGAANTERFGWDVHHLTAYFYADNGLFRVTY